MIMKNLFIQFLDFNNPSIKVIMKKIVLKKICQLEETVVKFTKLRYKKDKIFKQLSIINRVRIIHH